MKRILVFLTLSLPLFSMRAQNPQQRYAEYGEVIIAQLSSAPFPDPKRAQGHTYENQVYPAEKHYRDSSVAIFIPKGFRPTETTDFVLHFHGWSNTIDSVLRQFELIEQFVESGKNAILVVPQGPRNAPDSYGGKLEDQNGFNRLMGDVVELLVKQKRIKSRKIGNIILSGHSGGYRVISFILMRGGLTNHVKEVFLFDALYSQTEKFVYWLDHYNGKLINIYTEDGGTKVETENLIADLQGWDIPFLAKNDAEVSSGDLKKNRLIFLFTTLTHDQVVSKNKNFREYLRASILKKR